MKLTGRDLPQLQWSLLSTLGLLMLAGLLTAWSWHNEQQAKQEHARSSLSQQQLEQRLRQVHDEELALKESGRVFQEIQNSGMVGEENRLDWTESLAASQHELRLPGMKYTFAPQTVLASVDGNNQGYFVSPMHLELSLLHEQDLLDFLSLLRAKAKAMLLVRSCKLAPKEEHIEASTLPVQLQGTCELEWLTLRLPTEKR